MNRLTIMIITICSLALGQTTDLFFSEYAEGSSNNKYIEIYNGTGTDVDLSGYSLSSCSNGCNTTDEWDYPDNVTFASGTIITDGDVFVVYHGSADAAIAAEGDQTFTYLSNGDDVFALTAAGATADTYTIIDIIGEMGGDPGSGWDVAGVTDATKDHTLVRKATVTSGNTDWTSSAGTTTDDSEWIVYAQNTWDYLGSHPHVDPAIAISSPMDGETFYSPDVTVSFDVSSFTVAAAGSGDGHIHYALDGGTTVMQYTTSDIALTGLSEASHTFIIWLVDDSHANLSPHVANTVTFTVAPQPTVNVITIAEARAYPIGSSATVQGIVTSPNFGGYYTSYTIQDSTAGIVVYASSSAIDPPATLALGDKVEVTGTIVEYNGLLEISPSGADDITVLSSGNTLPDAQEVTVATLLTNGEDYESEIIVIESVSITSGTWPDEGSSGYLTITDDNETSTITMKIDSDTDIDGQTQPQEPFIVTAVVGQSSDYQVLPRYYTDFVTVGAVVPTIADVTMNPTAPTDADDVTISATITDDGTIASASLDYHDGTTTPL